jgi:hypothetical protein
MNLRGCGWSKRWSDPIWLYDADDMMRIAVRALILFVLATALYWGTALSFRNSTTPDVAYFNHLADAFLHGRTYLVAPPSTHDLTAHQGRWYVPFPPLPALLMMPPVWGLGLARVNTVFFCALFGGLNVALIFLLVTTLSGRGWSKLATPDHLWLTVLFGLGSVHWYMATIGSVWFVAQVCTVTFVALAVWLAVRAPWGRATPWLAGLALACAVLARPNVILTWPLLIGIALMDQRAGGGGIATAAKQWRRVLAWAAASALPLVLAVGALLAYNWVRFADPFEFGYRAANVAEKLADDLRTFGQFHLHYAPKNFWAMLLAGPQWDDALNFWKPDPEGMSLLLTTPALIYLRRALLRTPLAIGAWGALGLLLIPLLLYYNTGWWQFGYRFSLDFMVPVVVLLALAAGNRIGWAMKALILVGVVVNLYGVIWWHS